MIQHTTQSQFCQVRTCLKSILNYYSVINVVDQLSLSQAQSLTYYSFREILSRFGFTLSLLTG